MAGAPRNTKQKQAVYEALTCLDHPTATQVYEYVHVGHPTLSRGTVFRVLGGFAANGQVRRVTLEGSDARFDHTLAPHAHGMCRVCGRICDIFLPDYEAIAKDARTDGFEIDGCEVEFTGICKECSEKMRRGAKEEYKEKYDERTQGKQDA